MQNLNLIKILLLGSTSFIVAYILTPVLTNFLYKNNLGKNIRSAQLAPIYNKLHSAKAGTPTMGGILIWGTVALFIVFFWLCDRFFHIESVSFLNFLSRRETLLPFGAFIGSAIVGLVDDWLDVKKLGHENKGLRFRYKIWLYLLVSAIGAYWFYFKLDFTFIKIPFFGSFDLGFWFIPFFILMVTGVSFAVNLSDGLDGLAGGLLLIAFVSYAVIAYTQGDYNLAALIAVLCGALLTFLWFNVYPARFFMGDTGSMGMGVLLAIIAFLTNSVLLLFCFGFIFFLEAISTLLQLFWKRYFKRKLFLSSPLHHHFEALGWPETKVTMRFWIIAAVMSSLGLIVYFINL
jgi:phospho-N-acetylmuramoyl-pentapeptide-transferase